MNVSFLILLCFLMFFPNASAQVKVVSSEEPPTNYTYHGQFTGITTDIVKAILKRLNLQINIEVKPAARSLINAKNEPNVIIFTLGKTPQRIAHGFHFIGPVITRKHSLWGISSRSFNITSIEDIKKNNLTIGTVRGDWRANFFRDQGIKTQEVKLNSQNLKKLLASRVDLWVSSGLETPAITKALGVNLSQIKMVYVFKESPSYIVLSKNTEQTTINAWRKAYSALQETDFFINNAKKWSNILAVELSYNKDNGFYVR
jgi:polar amino acid transport system substrate-binding protein